MTSNIGKNLLHVVKVSHSKSSHKINIPVDVAKETGIDKAGYVVIVKKGDKKLEVKRYDSEKDLREYVQGNIG